MCNAAPVDVRAPALSTEGRRPPMFDETVRKKAHASRKARIEAGARFRRDWLDAPTWDLLAARRGLRLPQWHIPPTPRKLILTWLALSKSASFADVFGCSPKRLIELNPTTPLRAFIGQMLEQASG